MRYNACFLCSFLWYGIHTQWERKSLHWKHLEEDTIGVHVCETKNEFQDNNGTNSLEPIFFFYSMPLPMSQPFHSIPLFRSNVVHA